MKRTRGKPIPEETMRKVFDAQNGKCASCKCVQLDTAPHHRKYRSRGGSNDFINLVWLCRDCHNRAHAGDPEMAMFRTSREQQEGETEKSLEL